MAPKAAPKAKAAAASTGPGGPLHNAAVYVRIRPHAEVNSGSGHSETKLEGAGLGKKLAGFTEETISVLDRHATTEYTFPKKVFTPDSNQQQVYDAIMSDLLETFTKPNGTNVLLFAYGQTGTGKTHTMFGHNKCFEGDNMDQFDSEWGLFPRLTDSVFELIQRSSGERNMMLFGSAVEFYGMGGCDLLNNNTPIVVDESSEPIGHSFRRLSNTRDVMEYLLTIRAARTTDSTRMNAGSSRSHCALILTLFQLDRSNNEYCKTMFSLIDLAGAERPSATGEARMTGYEAMVEFMSGKPSKGAQGILINYELSMMMSEVAVATDHHSSRKKYAPTKALSTPGVCFMGSCFTGNSKLAMIVCISQSDAFGWETWFSCQMGMHLAKLKAPLVRRKGQDLGKAKKEAKADHAKFVDLLAKTPKKDHPSSKYFPFRQAMVRHTEHLQEVFQAFDGDSSSGPPPPAPSAAKKGSGQAEADAEQESTETGRKEGKEGSRG
uniref:Kinesin motor domain-containing protein n=1 Tax=Chromera velia CCMP2878 TaxID=1169474 RepID=A0A0G4I5V4_9ALVE|eukprot:Cvel_1872.t1-p1 / transcript=Cvel_1872.t1 / gene=Cvel_1872 / organism=Chromera_velia_CCMP2878 / gene_product=Kinesin heavy chain, putative / transcript_product=Kinesin heavy chain, putative / location=Cvel_scaffold69:132094-134846(-) / protein_length=492 / sequence_SO=supercontig / SO=protein_coding / is_pseudo=false